MFLAGLFCVATNSMFVMSLPLSKPDAPMLAFSALAMGVYLRIIYFGLTPKRALWFGIWMALGVSGKEIAGPMFVLPCIGLLWVCWPGRQGEADTRTLFWKSLGRAVAGAVVTYSIVNIAYAPRTWLECMHFWLHGAGADASIWGGSGALAQMKGMALCMVDNLGPGGTLVAALAVIVLLYRRPQHWLLLCLPFISVVALGLAPVGYTQTRFFTIAALSLVPPVALGLSVLLDAAGRLGAGWRLLLIRVPIGAAVVANLIAGSFAWICPGGLQAKAMEQVALTLPKCSQIFVLSGEFNFPHHKGASRLEWLGYDVDLRTVQDLMAHPESRPEWLFANQGMVHFIDDCATLPARAKMLKAESGFDFGQWRGWRRWGTRR